MKKLVLFRILPYIIVSLLLLPEDIWAQIIRGTVSDGDGKPLAGAIVRVSDYAAGAVADREGNYTLKNLPKERSITLLFSAVGFETVRKPITFRSADTLRVDVQLSSKILTSDAVVVSAGKRVQAVQDVPVSVSLVSSTDIQERNITRLDDALRYVPGVNLTRDQVNIRGSSGFSLGLGSRVAFLLDGFPMLAGDGGDVKFDALPVFSADRIEVIKGAGSALYGTSALGGVVNMITAEASETPVISFRSYAGAHTLPRYEMWRFRETMPFLAGFDAGISTKIGDVSLLLNGGYKWTDGHTDFQQSAQWNILGKIGYDVSEELSISLLFNYAHELRDNWVYWRSLRQATLPGTSTDESFTSLKAFGGVQARYLFDENTFLIVRSGLFHNSFFPEGESDGDAVISSANSVNNEVQLTSQILPNLTLTGGVNYLYNYIIDSPILDVATEDAQQHILSGYLQAEWQLISNLTLTIGGRYDVEQSGFLDRNYQFSPKAGASYIVSDMTTLRASAGVGFRAPTLGERFAALRFGSFVVTPNPALRYEQSVSYEVGGSHRFSLFGRSWLFDAAAFVNTFEDLIEPRFPSAQNPSIQFQNITKARIIGTELSLSGSLPANIGEMETSLTLLDPRDLTTDDELKYRTPLLWYSRIAVPFGQFQMQAEYRYLARVKNIDTEIENIITDAGARVAVHVIDLRVSYTFAQDFGVPLRLSLIARNLLDYYYVEVIGNLAPTRSILLQTDFRL